jgi:hypothetical protein
MRLISAVTLGAFAFGLSGCQSEESYRASFRSQALSNCRSGATPATTSQLSQIGMTPESACTCAVDRYMRGASYDQLKRDANNQSALDTSMIQCVSEQTQRQSAATMNEANRALQSATTDANRALETATNEVDRAQADMENATDGN